MQRLPMGLSMATSPETPISMFPEK